MSKKQKKNRSNKGEFE